MFSFLTWFFILITVDDDVKHHQARRSHSIGNIDTSMRQKIEKPIDFETSEVQSPPRKVLKVPQNLREQINGRSPPRTSTPSSDLNVSVSPYEIISLSRYVDMGVKLWVFRGSVNFASNVVDLSARNKNINKFANFSRLNFPTFCNQTLPFY